jgi:hypothetical protein
MRDMAVGDEIQVIEENGGTRHAASTPSDLGKGQEEEENIMGVGYTIYVLRIVNIYYLYF